MIIIIIIIIIISFIFGSLFNAILRYRCKMSSFGHALENYVYVDNHVYHFLWWSQYASLRGFM